MTIFCELCLRVKVGTQEPKSVLCSPSAWQDVISGCGSVRNSTMFGLVCLLRIGARGREIGHCKNETRAYRYARESPAGKWSEVRQARRQHSVCRQHAGVL